jgi:DNA-binding transcriptional MerR regulator
MHASDSTTYTITELAKEFDVTTRTIRFYEDKGLLKPARQGLTRIYSARDRVRLKLVLRGKRIGFSLDEVREIMDMYDSAPGEIGQLDYMLDKLAERRAMLHRRQQDIELTLKELNEIEVQCRERLATMVKQTPRSQVS